MEIQRDRYLKKIISFMWDGQVKVITGSEDRAVNYHSDSVGTRLNYEVVSCAITSMRSGAPMSADWKAPIEADYKTRKGEKN